MSEPDAPRGHGFDLPLVSVVVVNYNYGAYLEAAVRSVFEQTYTRVECILLDNASTDDSPAVIAVLEQRYPALKVVRRARNDGQCIASAEGFFASRGDYVVFLDADDVLLATFVSTHIFVHLSLRIPVAFSCSDMLQSSVDGLVLGGFAALNAFVRRDEGKRSDLLRPTHAISQTQIDALTPLTPDDVLFCTPQERGWPWSSTSAFLFRRDALAVVLDNPDLNVISCALDVYLARGLNALFGSVVIDRALTVYRMHGSNIYARHPELNRWFNFDKGGSNDQERRAREALVDLMIRRADLHLRKFADPNAYFEALATISETKPRLTSSRGGSYAGRAILDALPHLRTRVDALTLTKWLIYLRLSPIAVLAAFIRTSAR